MPSLYYRPAIDGLRAVAVLSVFVFHLNHKWLPGGFVGVDVFFVISGYLITSIILKDCESGEFSLQKFYQRRIARIFPAFFTVAGATLFAAAWIYSPQDYASAGANLVAATLSMANLKYMLQGNYFEISSDAQPFLHYWSLSVEEQFYLFFPLFVVLLFKFARRQLFLYISCVAIVSLVACLLLTPLKPVWAFYLLPTRAWELCAGALLAVVPNRTSVLSGGPTRPQWIPVLGLILIACSLILIQEGPLFPGWRAIIPVLGASSLLYPCGYPNDYVENFLAWPPLVWIGRMSYSLYLWHWPVFSFVDYQLYLSSEPLRLCLKIGISILLAILSYLWIENPSRSFLNQRGNRTIAYATITALIVICVSLGISIRRNHYVNADSKDVSNGGLVFPGKQGGASIVLMGDSNGSMYGKVMKEICAENGYHLTVISTAAGDPLPVSNGDRNPLWDDCLSVVKTAKPSILVLACQWSEKLDQNRGRLRNAIGSLAPFTSKIIILNQPPALPQSANRASMRNGIRPPFIESHSIREKRLMINEYLLNLVSEKVTVVDVACKFQKKDGEVLVLNEYGRQLYHDCSHLSGFGAELVRTELKKALNSQ